ncbi:MAG: prepilin-type N-terminal cleavage/methylation domain-containing protein [Thermodesulfobacteriota bacterium]|jgi:prepilin-type N-terminal cleavage/methylation domain-containing protein
MVPRRKKGIRSAQKGFTLVESSIVVGILTIVAAIAIPEFRKMAVNGNLKAAARDLIADFSSLRRRAMSENTKFSVKFDVAQNNYMIQGAGTNRIKTPAHFGNDIMISNADFGGVSTIKFHTRGTTSLGTVILTNIRSSTATITTNITGRTHVHFDFR